MSRGSRTRPCHPDVRVRPQMAVGPRVHDESPRMQQVRFLDSAFQPADATLSARLRKDRPASDELHPEAVVPERVPVLPGGAVKLGQYSLIASAVVMLFGAVSAARAQLDLRRRAAARSGRPCRASRTSSVPAAAVANRNCAIAATLGCGRNRAAATPTPTGAKTRAASAWWCERRTADTPRSRTGWIPAASKARLREADRAALSGPDHPADLAVGQPGQRAVRGHGSEGGALLDLRGRDGLGLRRQDLLLFSDRGGAQSEFQKFRD